VYFNVKENDNEAVVSIMEKVFQ